MGKPLATIRLAVGSPSGPRSCIWRIVVGKKDDIYVITSSAMTSDKLSFHRSHICRWAFTEQFGTPEGMTDRVMKRWRRSKTPPAGSGRGTSVAEVIFPTDYLSTSFAPSDYGGVCWIEPAPTGRSAAFELFFCNDGPDVVSEQFKANGRRILEAVPLSSGEFFFASSHTVDFAGQDIRLPATSLRKHDLIASKIDYRFSGRPVRFLMMKDIGDGDKLIISEYGMFPVNPGDLPHIRAQLNPQRLFFSTAWKQDLT